MTLAPRFLVNLWFGFRVAKFVRRLKSAGRGIAAQQETFNGLMRQFSNTEFGRTHGLARDTSYAQFRESVPPRLYAYFEPLVYRMFSGEAGILLGERCHFFVETASTTGDRSKLLPVPEAMLKHYRGALRDALRRRPVHRLQHKGRDRPHRRAAA